MFEVAKDVFAVIGLIAVAACGVIALFAVVGNSIQRSGRNPFN